MKNYQQKNKWSLLVLAVSLVVIFVSSLFASMIQSDFYKVKVTDLQNVTNTGTKELVAVDAGVSTTFKAKIDGSVASGILFMPKAASATNKRPAIVLTHGYLNNRELQLQNAIELSSRGFIVLTIDRGGHGNNEVSANTSAMMNTSGLYESVKYVYNLPEVDTTRIGVSGHSMGGYSTASLLATDSTSNVNWTKSGTTYTSSGKGLGLVNAGLIQGWSSFMGAGSKVSVGLLKAKDDEFFFTSTLADGTPSVSREYLHSKAAATFVGATVSGNAKDSINIENAGIYVEGSVKDVLPGFAVGSPFRVVYEADEIHPQNHFSTKSAKYVTNFFYTAFGTPAGEKFVKETHQTWWIKEGFSTLGLIAFFAMLLPIVNLLLTIPYFASLKRKEDQVEELPELKGLRKHVSYWCAAVATTVFSGAAVKWMWDSKNWLSGFNKFLTQSVYFPQDTTGKVAMWAVVCGLFGVLAVSVVWVINRIIDAFQKSEKHEAFPLTSLNVSGSVVAKSFLLASFVVAIMFVVVFINWEIFLVDFRFWTVVIKPFEFFVMFPTMMRYAAVFAIYYVIHSALATTYRVKNLPEWATIAINAVFVVLGLFVITLIQYGTFRSTGKLWDTDPLKYIVLFPVVPVLIIATIYARRIYLKTGNAWLAGFINALLFTIMTVASTAASFPYNGF